MMYRLLAILVVFLLAGCEATPEPTNSKARPNDTTARAHPVDPSISSDTTTAPSHSAHQDAQSLGVSLATLLDQSSQRTENGELAVLDRLSEPARVETETQPNRHRPDQTDTLRTRHYDGLALTIYQTASKEILKNITVTSDRYQTEGGIHVGMSRTQLESQWGEPSQRTGSAYVYERDGPMPTHVRVGFSGDTVSRLAWQYPID